MTKILNASVTAKKYSSIFKITTKSTKINLIKQQIEFFLNLID